jgi:hypothetical protein
MPMTGQTHQTGEPCVSFEARWRKLGSGSAQCSAENAAWGRLEAHPFGVSELTTFFFDISIGADLVVDPVGSELVSIEAAWEYARQTALELASEHLQQAAAEDCRSRQAPAAVFIRGMGAGCLGAVDVVETASNALCGVSAKQTYLAQVSTAWVVAETDVERQSAADVIRTHGYEVQKLANVETVLEALAEFGLERPKLRLGRPLLFAVLDDVAKNYGLLLSLRTVCPTLFFVIASDSPHLQSIDVISLPRAFTCAQLEGVLTDGLDWPP